MTLYKNRYRIESARLKGWDYSSEGYYFITICTKNRIPFFGRIKNKKMILNDIGKIAEKYWMEIPDHFQFIKLDSFIIMPDHIHGIIIINNSMGRDKVLPCLYHNNDQIHNNIKMKQLSRYQNPGKGSISTIIGSYKSICTRMINQKNKNLNFTWLSRFHDRIIRNENELIRKRKYIENNPEKAVFMQRRD
ncbi:MAG: transposase [Spirochaetes bacterium]|nr:transposase [Spirochaetota bacterium]